MPPWIDFHTIKERVSIEAVLLDYYGLDTLKRRGQSLVGPCPVHGGDNPRAFHANLTTGLWHCFSRCGRGGDQLSLVALREDVSLTEAAARLAAYASLDATHRAPNRPRPPPSPKTAAVNHPLSFRLTVEHHHPHLQETRGLAVSTCRRFGVGCARYGMLRGMIAVPLHDAHGRLVAYAGRRLDRESIVRYGKYRFPRGLHKELVLYGWHRCRTLAREQPIILVEGIFSVLALYEAGYPNAVAALGCHLSDEQATLLEDAKRVTVLFDGDDAGRDGAQRAASLLASHAIQNEVISLADGEEPESLDLARRNVLLGPPPTPTSFVRG